MTAEEFLKGKRYVILAGSDDYSKEIQGYLIEYAKIHVQKALEEVSAKAKSYVDSNGEWTSSNVDSFVSKDSILNAYPLENIK